MSNSNDKLHKVKSTMIGHPQIIKIVAKLISYIFHPVFVPIYIAWFLVYEHPYLFAGFGPREKLFVMAQAFAMFTFFPLVTVLLLKALHFIESIQLKKQKDRIIPLIACMVWYFWIWRVWKNLPGYPQAAIVFAMAVFVSSWIGLMANVKIKISLHAIAMGIAVAFLLLLAFTQELNFGLYIAVALLIAGLVCTSRLAVSDHTVKEVYIGFVAGVISVLIARYIGMFWE